jgi:2-polyprenyl-6-hydroxyphenyl methylase/3-demethylubiquinone-9 3-methyltransferase
VVTPVADRATHRPREAPLEYPHGCEAPCTDAYLAPLILRICRERQARTVLDIGCGNGTLCRRLADAGFMVTGMEPSESGVACARRLVPEATIVAAGVYDDPSILGGTRFDAVVCTEVVEHLFLPRVLPHFASRVLAPGGSLIVSSPYHGYLKNLALALAGMWDRHHDPLWDGGHIKFWSRCTLSRLFEAEGFTVKSCVGAGRVPLLWKSMVLVAMRAADNNVGAAAARRRE